MQFGKYELLEPIATGGMAEVFRAKISGDAGFERIVAIKRILPHLCEDRDFVDMFVDEAKIAVQLSHANIAQILDLGKVGKVIFIALEYVHGRDLRAIYAAEQRNMRGLPMPIAVHITMKVAEALGYAHRAVGRDGRPLSLIHRDVSPHNILVSFEGEVKVIDFGLAKASGRVSQTQAGVLKGKLAYLSPEQAFGQPIDHRSDIFALGVCFYEMLSGQRLFLRKGDIDTILAIRNAQLPPLRTFAPHVPPELETIVYRALERDRDARYQSAQEMFEALQELSFAAGMYVSRRQLAEYLRNLFPADVAAAQSPDGTVELDLLEVEDDVIESTTSQSSYPPPPLDDESFDDVTAIVRADEIEEVGADSFDDESGERLTERPLGLPGERSMKDEPDEDPDTSDVVVQRRDTIPAPLAGEGTLVERLDDVFPDDADVQTVEEVIDDETIADDSLSGILGPSLADLLDAPPDETQPRRKKKNGDTTQ